MANQNIRNETANSRKEKAHHCATPAMPPANAVMACEKNVEEVKKQNSKSQHTTTDRIELARVTL
jgi:hypothetical protein